MVTTPQRSEGALKKSPCEPLFIKLFKLISYTLCSGKREEKRER